MISRTNNNGHILVCFLSKPLVIIKLFIALFGSHMEPFFDIIIGFSLEKNTFTKKVFNFLEKGKKKLIQMKVCLFLMFPLL